MDEVTPAVIAIAFGLSAVFVPVAFISGITGQFYRQFALTISILDAAVGVQLADAQPGAGGAAAAAAARASRTGSTRTLELAASAGSSGCSTAGFDGVDRRLRRRSLRRVVRFAVVALVVYVGLDLSDVPRVSRRCRPGSSRSRTGVPDRRRCRCPTPRRSTAPTTVMRRMAEIANDTPGVQRRVRDHGLLGPHRRRTSPTPARCSSSLNRFEERKGHPELIGRRDRRQADGRSTRRSRKGSRWSSRRRRCAASGTAGGFKMQVRGPHRAGDAAGTAGGHRRR